jgi:hypothetical protein
VYLSEVLQEGAELVRVGGLAQLLELAAQPIDPSKLGPLAFQDWYLTVKPELENSHKAAHTRNPARMELDMYQRALTALIVEDERARDAVKALAELHRRAHLEQLAAQNELEALQERREPVRAELGLVEEQLKSHSTLALAHMQSQLRNELQALDSKIRGAKRALLAAQDELSERLSEKRRGAGRALRVAARRARRRRAIAQAKIPGDIPAVSFRRWQRARAHRSRRRGAEAPCSQRPAQQPCSGQLRLRAA